MTIINADNLTALRDASLFPDESIDLVITSPPYSHLRTYESEIDVPALSEALFRVMKPGGVVVWIEGDACVNGAKTMMSARHMFEFTAAGKFFLNDDIILHKNTSAFPARVNGKRHTQIYEHMFVFVRRGKGVKFPKTVNLLCDKKNLTSQTSWGNASRRNAKDSDIIMPDVKKVSQTPEFSPRTNVWPVFITGIYEFKKRATAIHPAVFPLQLAEDHVLTWSNPGDAVLDVFSGSGTTVIAALKHGRSAIGIEISEKYASASREHIEWAKTKFAIAN